MSQSLQFRSCELWFSSCCNACRSASLVTERTASLSESSISSRSLWIQNSPSGKPLLIEFSSLRSVNSILNAAFRPAIAKFGDILTRSGSVDSPALDDAEDHTSTVIVSSPLPLVLCGWPFAPGSFCDGCAFEKEFSAPSCCCATTLFGVCALFSCAPTEIASSPAIKNAIIHSFFTSLSSPPQVPFTRGLRTVRSVFHHSGDGFFRPT